jgi:hypothetical protein
MESKIKEIKKDRLIGSKVALFIGLLGIISASSSPNNSVNFVTGNLIFFGALAYMARRKQNITPSKKWFVAEVLSVLWVAWLILLGILSGKWYSQPLAIVIIPLWIGIAYSFALFRRDKTKTVQ